ncbi:unnamed protein product [Rotaria socialis]|uniref:NAD(P)-binding domain-containing protein n=2 Tax=Rotaria socialis TaxID=392032 RepID=A0A818YQF1_9BILA|nr:unnamed protein product [Rotaria socialis]
MSENLIALLTGYTGESGKALLKELEQRQIDFEKIDDYPEAFHGADMHFCCLGTTRGKSGVEGFRRVDFDYIVGVARLAKQEGCKHFHLLSSLGADSHSLFLYNKVKGQTETALTQMSFERLSIYRPAMLMVDRTEHRPLENFAQTIMRNTVQRIAPEWMTTPIDILARAMYLNSFTKDRPSIEILDNHALFRLSQQQTFTTKEQSQATNES